MLKSKCCPQLQAITSELATNKIALATSGGRDSIALLHLLHKEPYELTIITVNHNLRQEARKEVLFVQNLCVELGLQFVALEWQHNGISSNVHDQARKARYDLLTNYCQHKNIQLLLTAHHQDDRIENFFIRASRGSGLLGLVDYERIAYNNITVFRPLFHVTRKEINDYLAKHELKWCEDNSNSDSKYLRSNIRTWLQNLPNAINPEIFNQHIITTKDNLARSAEIITTIFEQEMQQCVKFSNLGYAVISNLSNHKDITYMMLAKILQIISGDFTKPRLDALILLYTDLQKTGFTAKTLHGCVIKKHQGNFLVYREEGRMPKQAIPLEFGAMWDRRFTCCKLPQLTHELVIQKLTFKQYITIKPQLVAKLNLFPLKALIFTIPVLMHLEKLVAIPHIEYYDDSYELLANIEFAFHHKTLQYK